MENFFIITITIGIVLMFNTKIARVMAHIFNTVLHLPHPGSKAPQELSVKEFAYNGFFVNIIDENLTPYTANFIRWTNDPGIALCKCSDGVERLIPSCALVVNGSKLPKQCYNDHGPDIFGIPSKS